MIFCQFLRAQIQCYQKTGRQLFEHQDMGVHHEMSHLRRRNCGADGPKRYVVDYLSFAVLFRWYDCILITNHRSFDAGSVSTALVIDSFVVIVDMLLHVLWLIVACMHVCDLNFGYHERLFVACMHA
jgi:hypothetical protein